MDAETLTQLITGVILFTCLAGWFVAIQSIKTKIHKRGN